MVKKGWLLLGLTLAATAGAYGQKTIGEVFSGEASVRGSVLLTAQGTRVLSGSEVTAGGGAALLKLTRGGQVRICPKTNLSLGADASGRTLSLGLNAGSMELDYTLASSSDTLMTPDFRLQLVSPGSFHLAISVSAAGDTCLRSLPGNNASVFVAEMLGNESYQLSPGKNVMFVGGKISGASEAPEVCGCPEASPPPMVASETEENAAGPAVGDATSNATLNPTLSSTLSAAPSATLPAETAPGTPSGTAAVANPAEQPEAATAKAENKAEGSPPAAAHLEVESQFVYRGDDAVQDFYGSVSHLSLSTDNSKLALALLPQVSGPAAPLAAVKKTGFKHWLGRLFGH
jgi:hypothetical protein